MAALEPYRFEPERVPDANESSDDEDDGAERLLNLNWCTCGRCELRESARECICCLEEPESENKFTEGTLYSLYSYMQMHASIKAITFADDCYFR